MSFAVTPLERVLDALGEHVVSRRDKQAAARCPVHDDREPSLAIGIGSNGQVLLKCHAGCTTETVVSALGLEMKDLFPLSTLSNRRERSSDRSPRTIECVYRYTTEEGTVLFEVVRFHPKTFRQRQPDGNGGYIWNLNGVRKVPYRLPELIEARGEVPLVVCEGEKDVDRLAELGVPATTSPGGAGKWHLLDPESIEVAFREREVVVIADNDDAGRDHARTVARALQGIARRIRIIENLPDVPEKGDISDWLSAGHGAKDLLQLIEAAPEWAESDTEPASPPEPSSTPKFVPFPLDALPPPVREYVVEVSESIGCDPSFVAGPTLAVLAASIGNSRCITLKAGWSEHAILWTVIVGESGTKKSPAIRAPMKPLRELQEAALRRHEDATERFAQAKAQYEKDLAQWKRRNSTDLPPLPPDEPVAERLFTSDATVEAIAVLLNQQPRGLLFFRDELAAWVRGFNQYKGGKGSDAANWLETHQAGTMMVDRKGDPKTLYVPRASVSVTGGIQPGILGRALGQEHFEDGFAARLLVAYPPRTPKRWSEAEISEETEYKLKAIVSKLQALEMELGQEGKPQPKFLGLEPAAKDAWVTFYNEHAEEQSNLSGPLAATWSKLEAAAARLALVLHLAREDTDGSGPIDAESIQAGVLLSRWYGREAERVYAVLTESEQGRERRQTIERIRRKGGKVSVRDWHRMRKHDKADQARDELEALVQAGLGSWEPSENKTGRPTEVFVLR